MSAAGAALAIAVALQVTAPPSKPAGVPTALEKCRALDKEFDTKNMPKPCQAAADDATLGIPERVEALRRLAFAHILNGDESLAEPAFLKMLVFSPAAELPADAGPRFREIFAAVKKRFDTEGALTVTFTPPPAPQDAAPVELQIDVGDKLGRVVGAKVKSTVEGEAAPREDALVRNELTPGQLRFTGAVPEPHEPGARHVTYDVELDGWDGAPIAVPTPVHGEFDRTGGVVAGADGGFPWVWVGAGSAAGVAVIGGVTGGIIWCYTAGPCRTQDAWVRVQIHQGEP